MASERILRSSTMKNALICCQLDFVVRRTSSPSNAAFIYGRFTTSVTLSRASRLQWQRCVLILAGRFAQAGNVPDLLRVERFGFQQGLARASSLSRCSANSRSASRWLSSTMRRTSASISSEVASLYGWCWKAGGRPSSWGATKLIGPSFSLIPQRNTM